MCECALIRSKNNSTAKTTRQKKVKHVRKKHTNKQRDVQRAVASVTAAEWQRKQQLLRLLKRTAKECRQSVCRKRAL